MRYSLIVALFLVFATFLPASAQDQLITNGSFEVDTSGWTNTKPDICPYFQVEGAGFGNGGFNGTNSLHWKCIGTNNRNYARRVLQPITLQKGKRYVIRFAAKTEAYYGQPGGKNLVLNVFPCGTELNGGLRQFNINSTTKWRVFTVAFRSKVEGCADFAIGGPVDSQAIWIDQVGIKLEQASAADASDEPVLIEATGEDEATPELFLPVIER